MSEHAIHCEKSMRWHFIIIIGYYVTNLITHILIFGQVKKGVFFFLSLTFTMFFIPMCRCFCAFLRLLHGRNFGFFFFLIFRLHFKRDYFVFITHFVLFDPLHFLRSVSFLHWNYSISLVCLNDFVGLFEWFRSFHPWIRSINIWFKFMFDTFYFYDRHETNHINTGQ